VLTVSRGIPTGYLGTLEQRLNETEIALYNALSEIRNLRGQDQFIVALEAAATFVSPEMAPRELNASKLSRMQEWKDYPLNDAAGIERWRGFFSKNEIPAQSKILTISACKDYCLLTYSRSTRRTIRNGQDSRPHLRHPIAWGLVHPISKRHETCCCS
jgi:hypothetical protein